MVSRKALLADGKGTRMASVDQYTATDVSIQDYSLGYGPLI